ncbi:MAG: OmpA family protein [Sphingobacteriales bacterium]|nr:OmpA family protein [Sphingobacteriales bacterium]
MNIFFNKRNYKPAIKKYPGLAIQLSAIVTLIFLCSYNLNAQSQKLALAEKYYANGDYYTAAGLYEQYLNPVKREIPRANFPLNAKRFRTGGGGIEMGKMEVLFKQAGSYRLANYYTEASERYKKCYDKDKVKYADALYWYAVCQRSLGNYKEAEESLSNFISAGNGDNIAAAKKELVTVHFINTQLKRPDTILYHVTKSNTSFGNEKGVYAPAVIKENQYLFTSTDKDTLSKYGVNPYHNRIYTATYDNNSIELNNLIDIKNIEGSANQGAACVSADGNILYFTQWNKVNGKSLSSIYYSVKKGNEWNSPVLLSSVNMSGYNSKQPSFSADGKILFFASDRKGGAGGFDIWYAPLSPDGTTGEPVNIAAVNTESDEQAPFYHSTTNTLVFSSNGRLGMGGFDFFTSKQKDGQWTAPENMGHPVNSSRDDIYFLSAEGQPLLKEALISSDRGSSCCLETYALSKAPKSRKINGVVRDIKNNQPVEGATVVMKDADGKTIQTTTDADGKFSFDLTGEVAQKEFTVTKEKYKDKTETAVVETINESDWLTDVVNNVPILMEKKLVIKVENVVTVYFDFDKYDIKPRSAEVLDSIYTVLTENPEATIQISGYTDGLGTVEYNAILSDKRARYCADYLVAKGIDSGRITFESFGECCPVEMELLNGRDNPDGRSKNRRALININKPDKE